MVANRVFNDAHLAGARLRIAGQKALPDAVVARVWQFHARACQHALVVCMWDMKENAGAVSGTRIAPRRTPVSQAPQYLDALADHVVRRRTTQIRDKAETAGVALERGVV